MKITEIMDPNKLLNEIKIEKRMQSLHMHAIRKRVRDALIWLSDVTPDRIEYYQQMQKGILILVTKRESMVFLLKLGLQLYGYSSVGNIQKFEKLIPLKDKQIPVPALFLLQEYMDGQMVQPILKINPFLITALDRFFPKPLFISSHFIQYLFSDEKTPSESNSLIFPVLSGYGDLFILMPILHDLSKHHQISGIAVIDERMILITKKLLTQPIPIYATDYATLYHLTVHAINKQTTLYGNLMIPMLVHPEQANYIYEDIINHLSAAGFINKTPTEIYNNYLLDRSKLELPAQSLFSSHYKHIIGFQRLSGTKIYHNNFLKEIPVDFTKQFIARCDREGIAVINLSPDEPFVALYHVDLKDMNMVQLLSYIQKMDLVMGVDSCFMHLCALIQKSSITLYCTTSAKYKLQSIKSMPVAYNLSIFPVDYDPSQLDLDTIWRQVVRILNHRQAVCDQYTSLTNKKRITHFIVCRHIDKIIS